MNAGFSSLAKLKAQILPPAMRARTDFDEQLVSLGIGVAMLLERYCDRRFTRISGDTFRQSANNVVISLPRYPVEVLTSVTLQTDAATLITDTVRRTDKAAGLVYFSTPPGAQDDELVIVYGGGYWWDITEDATGVMPEGATALPPDLAMAFFLQMKAVCEAQNIIGTGAAGGEKSKPAKSLELDLVPAVKTILNTYRRFG